MNITDFLNENKAKLKSARKIVVRDLDELTKNTFVAYADENAHSYDVQIVLDTKKNIVSTQCDCKQGGICLHIIALVDFMINQKTEKTVIKKAVKRKLTETDQILEALDHESLHVWIAELLNKNKEIAFLFKNTFATKNHTFDSHFIKSTVKECISAVIGKRRTIETNEVKKITDALTISLQPLLDYINSAPVSKEKYELLTELIDSLENIRYTYYISSVKITRFIESIHNNLLKSLFNIKDFDVWTTCSHFYFSQLFKDKIIDADLNFCKAIYEATNSNNQQRKVIVQFVEQNINKIVETAPGTTLNFSFDFEQFLLKVYSENDLFASNYKIFKPRRYKNEYNLELIKELVKINQTELVEHYCNDQINGNVNDKFDIPYVEILIAQYKIAGENKKLANLYSVYGKFIYDINVYHFIKENASEEVFKKYRMSVFSYARNSYQNGDVKAFDFYFGIKKLDGKEYDLFEMLTNSRNVFFLNKYKEIAINIRENKFMETLFRFNYDYYDDVEELKSIAKFVIANVEKEKLKIYLKQFSYHNYSKFNKILTELISSAS